MSRVLRALVVSVFSFAINMPSVSAQQAQDPGAAPVPQKIDKEQKRKIKRTLKELDSQYRQWLNEDVIYIISPEERNAFLQLDTNEDYASGIPGWKTDRGKMYIMWGPADEIESHPTGGTYDRPMEEGGGSTS